MFWIAGTSPAVSGWSRVCEVGTSTTPGGAEVDRPAIVHRGTLSSQHSAQCPICIVASPGRTNGVSLFFFSFSRLDRDLEADIEPPCESHSAFLPLRRIQGKRLIRRIKVQPSSWTATWFHHQCPSVIWTLVPGINFLLQCFLAGMSYHSPKHVTNNMHW